jgi:hypothetical protein
MNAGRILVAAALHRYRAGAFGETQIRNGWVGDFRKAPLFILSGDETWA